MKAFAARCPKATLPVVESEQTGIYTELVRDGRLEMATAGVKNTRVEAHQVG